MHHPEIDAGPILHRDIKPANILCNSDGVCLAPTLQWQCKPQPVMTSTSPTNQWRVEGMRGETSRRQRIQGS